MLTAPDRTIDAAVPRPASPALIVTDDPLSSSRAARSWQELAPLARTPFETWTWVGAMAAVPETPARVLTAWLGSRPVAALALESDRGPAGMRRLSLAGSSWLAADHNDVIADPVWSHAAALAFMRHLRRRSDWDLLDLDGLRPDGVLLSALDELSGPLFRRLPSEDVLCPYVSLAGRTGTEAAFSHNLRSQLRRGVRAMEKRGGGFDVITDPQSVQRALDTLMELHNARFGERSQVFNSPARRGFHRHVAGELARREMARIYRLHDGDRDIALLYALRFGDRSYYYSMGLRTDGGGSPGLTLLGNAILASAADGLAEFDLLRGEHDFKLRFAAGTRTDIRRRILRVSPRSGMRATAHLVRRAMAKEVAS